MSSEKIGCGPWLTWPRVNSQASLRLFCIPYAGGGPQIFQAWPDLLPSTVEVCSVLLPGRGKRFREPAFEALPPLVQSLASALLRYLDRPYALFGHSMGGLVSFEIVRELRRQAQLLPLHLFASGCFAPQIPDRHRIHDLPESQFIEELRRLNGLPEGVLQEKELLQLVLPTLRADMTASETYVYQEEAPLPCSITAFGGSQDPLVDRCALGAWRQQTTASFSLNILPGDHFFVHGSEAPLLQLLSGQLSQLAGTPSHMSLEGN